MVLAAIGAGLLIGVSLGALGGGSILTVPALVYLLGQSLHQATTTSLLVVGTAALAGAASHARAGRVRFREGTGTFAAAAIAGTLAGGHLAGRASPQHLRTAFTALIAGVGLDTLARSLPSLA